MTSSVSGKRSPAELIAPGNQKAGGGDGNRTRVHGFAGRCLTTRPLHRWGPRHLHLRADDGIRTRDPHLGKVMRYQLRYIRAPRTRSSPGAKHDDSPRERAHTNFLVRAVSRLARRRALRRGRYCRGLARASLRRRSPSRRRSRGSVGERPLHTRKVAGSIPAGTTIICAAQPIFFRPLRCGHAKYVPDRSLSPPRLSHAHRPCVTQLVCFA